MLTECSEGDFICAGRAAYQCTPMIHSAELFLASRKDVCEPCIIDLYGISCQTHI